MRGVPVSGRYAVHQSHALRLCLCCLRSNRFSYSHGNTFSSWWRDRGACYAGGCVCERVLELLFATPLMSKGRCLCYVVWRPCYSNLPFFPLTSDSYSSTSHSITSHSILFHPCPSHSYSILFHHIPFHPIPFHSILFHSIPSHLSEVTSCLFCTHPLHNVLLRPILSYLFLSHSILSYSVPSYPFLTYPVFLFRYVDVLCSHRSYGSHPDSAQTRP